MPKEVLFIASPGQLAREVGIFRKLALLMASPYCEVSYVDGIQGRDGVVTRPQQQAALAAEIIATRDVPDVSLVTHGRGALSAVEVLNRRDELGETSVRAFLIGAPLPSEEPYASSDFYDGIDNLSDDGVVKVLGQAELWQQYQPAIAPEALVPMPDVSDLANIGPATIRDIYSLIVH